MSKVLVVHVSYGCETGCCGHAIEIDDVEISGTFDLDHPPSSETEESWLKWAQEFVLEQCGPKHVADLDWENCRLIYD